MKDPAETALSQRLPVCGSVTLAFHCHCYEEGLDQTDSWSCFSPTRPVSGPVLPQAPQASTDPQPTPKRVYGEQGGVPRDPLCEHWVWQGPRMAQKAVPQVHTLRRRRWVHPVCFVSWEARGHTGRGSLRTSRSGQG